jgi:hypothetical protein
MNTKDINDDMATDLNSLNINNDSKNQESLVKEQEQAQEQDTKQYMDQPSENIYSRQMMSDINDPNNYQQTDTNNSGGYEDDYGAVDQPQQQPLKYRLMYNLKIAVIVTVLFIMFNLKIVNTMIIKYISKLSTKDGELSFIGLIAKAIIFGIILFSINYFI